MQNMAHPLRRITCTNERKRNRKKSFFEFLQQWDVFIWILKRKSHLSVFNCFSDGGWEVMTSLRDLSEMLKKIRLCFPANTAIPD